MQAGINITPTLTPPPLVQAVINEQLLQKWMIIYLKLKAILDVSQPGSATNGHLEKRKLNEIKGWC